MSGPLNLVAAPPIAAAAASAAIAGVSAVAGVAAGAAPFGAQLGGGGGDSAILIWILLAAVVIWLVYDTYFQGNLEYVVAKDGEAYEVQSLPDKKEAADLLADVRARLEQLTRHLEKAEPDDERTRRLIVQFRPDKISEGADHSKYTSYSVNKGERLVFCIRQKDSARTLMDLNTMLFVAIHEVAHICTTSVGHTTEFWDNMRWLLQHAINIGVYMDQDFKKPKQYCGIKITSSPLHM